MELKKKEKNYIWIIKITLFAFIMSFLFSLFSEYALTNLNLVFSIFILLLFILLGVIFDMIGVAVMSSPFGPFHSMNSKKVKSAKMAIKLINAKEKVSSFCNDVIGDICGILSGTVCILISESLSKFLNTNLLISTLIITSLSASLTIGGKAIGKKYATKNCVWITDKISKILSIFNKK